MTIIDIENMTAAELKTKRTEAISVMAVAGEGELAARYVQARLDAKLRDEKLAEQGATIVSLNAALLAANGRADENAGQAGELLAQIEGMKLTGEANHQTLQREIALRQNDAAAAKETIDQLAKELNHFRVLAESRRKALVDVMAFAGQLNAKVAPLLAE